MEYRKEVSDDMGRKYKVDEINLRVNDCIPFKNELYEGFCIRWDSDIGFGEYTIYRTIGSDIWMADSEYMDNDKDNEFLKELMKLFIEQIKIVNEFSSTGGIKHEFSRIFI